MRVTHLCLFYLNNGLTLGANILGSLYYHHHHNLGEQIEMIDIYSIPPDSTYGFGLLSHEISLKE